MERIVTGTVVVGRIGAAHGIQGWVKIHSYTEPAEGILDYRPLLVRKPGADWAAMQVLQGRRQGKGLVLQIEGYADRESALTLRGAEIGIAPEQLPPLPEDEFYWHQLEGLQVISQSGDAEVLLGSIDHMLATGANDVMVIKPCAGSLDKRERLVPFILDRFVSKVDLAAGKLWVDWDPEF